MLLPVCQNPLSGPRRCYHNLFRLMRKCDMLENLLLKDHTHTFVNDGGDVRELDFRFDVNGVKIGAPFHGEETAGIQWRLLRHNGDCWLKDASPFGERACSL